MTTFLNLLNMGGYGLYVWPAYGLVFAALALQLFFPWRRWQKLKGKQRSSDDESDHAQVK